MTIRHNAFQSKPHIYKDGDMHVYHLLFLRVHSPTIEQARSGWVLHYACDAKWSYSRARETRDFYERHGKVNIGG